MREFCDKDGKRVKILMVVVDDLLRAFSIVLYHRLKSLIMKQLLLIIAAFATLFISNALKASPVSETVTGNETITARAETERHIWIGTTTGVWQINKRNDKAVKYTSGNSVLPSDNVTGICVGKYGQVYIATSKGILHYDNFAMLVINTENSGLPSNDITSIATDDHGIIWVGTSDKGLVKMYNGKCKVYNTDNSDLSSDRITALEKDSQGGIVVRCEAEDMIATSSVL
jgi:ligand-binding sensor domain-containing protein